MAGADLSDVFAELSSLPHEPSEKRDVCHRCRYVQNRGAKNKYKLATPFLFILYSLLYAHTYRRPSTVCVCSCFPSEPIPIQTRVLIRQHPNEVRPPHGRLSYQFNTTTLACLGCQGSTNYSFTLIQCLHKC